jgi:hypothetical protein
VSIRSIRSLYRVLDIAAARNRLDHEIGIDFFYPTCEEEYGRQVAQVTRDCDRHHGMARRDELYKHLAASLLVVSIPASDSSPRSVYEAIFCGAIVAVSPSGYYDELPESMRRRVVLVDLADAMWLSKALDVAKRCATSPFEPCEHALAYCDERLLINRVIREIYGTL